MSGTSTWQRGVRRGLSSNWGGPSSATLATELSGETAGGKQFALSQNGYGLGT